LNPILHEIALTYFLTYYFEFPRTNYDNIKARVDAGAEHCGSCTKDAVMCDVCFIEEVEEQINNLAPFFENYRKSAI
jgi:hypothetical protein